jgi:hypothetical protein
LTNTKGAIITLQCTGALQHLIFAGEIKPCKILIPVKNCVDFWYIMEGMDMKNRILCLLIASIAVLMVMQPVAASVTPYFDDLAGFNAAAGSPAVAVNFDATPVSTDITGTTINGITFDSGAPPSAPLIVIKASDSYSAPGFAPPGSLMNRLFATSGDNVLSPGGVELAPGYDPLKEKDDLVMTFGTPVQAAGFDILFQELDTFSLVGVKVYDSSNTLIYENSFIPIPGAPSTSASGWDGGTTFVGFVSDSKNIARISISDDDGNNVNPDSNIGYDTIRVTKPVVGAPEFPLPAVPALVIIGMLGTILYIRRTREN